MDALAGCADVKLPGGSKAGEFLLHNGHDWIICPQVKEPVARGVKVFIGRCRQGAKYPRSLYIKVNIYFMEEHVRFSTGSEESNAFF